MTFEAFATTLRVLCITNDIDIRISGSDYYLVSLDKEIQVSLKNDYGNDIQIILKNIEITSCPFKYAYDTSNRSMARIVVPLSDFKNKGDAERAVRWMIETVSNNKMKKYNIFVKVFKWIKDLLWLKN